MRLFALATMLALGALLGLSPTKAFPQRRPNIPRPRVSNVTFPVTFTFNSDVGNVRTIDPPPNFDEKGNPKKYTKAELKKLKGDTPVEKKLVGYKADFSEVKVGDMVQVTISQLKGGTTKPAKKDKDAKKEDADADKPVKEAKPADKGTKTGKWVVTTHLFGKVTKVTGANTASAEPKMTIQVTTQVVGGVNPNARKGQTFDDEKYAATLIVINRRPPTNPGR